jgi:hypothetical protein
LCGRIRDDTEFKGGQGEGSSGDSFEFDILKKITIESPLLPSPYTDNILCHPETHPPLNYISKALDIRWMS